jgi:hypothetical protein
LAGAFEPIFTMTETRAACCSGVACSLPALTRQGSGSWNPSPPRRRRAGSVGRSRSATGSPVRTRGGPAVQSTFGRCDPVRVLVAVGQGQPCVLRKLARPRRKVGPAEGSKTGTACTDKKAHARGDGRRKFLPVMHRTGSFAPRHARGHPFVDADSSGERWQHRFGMNGPEEQTPAMGNGCRRGVNLRRVKRWWECGPRPSRLRSTTTGSPETQRTPCPVPGCNRLGTHAAEKTVEVVRDHRGGTRTAATMPRSEPGRELGGSGRKWACWRRGTRQSQERKARSI